MPPLPFPFSHFSLHPSPLPLPPLAPSRLLAVRREGKLGWSRLRSVCACCPTLLPVSCPLRLSEGPEASSFSPSFIFFHFLSLDPDFSHEKQRGFDLGATTALLPCFFFPLYLTASNLPASHWSLVYRGCYNLIRHDLGTIFMVFLWINKVFDLNNS